MLSYSFVDMHTRIVLGDRARSLTFSVVGDKQKEDRLLNPRRVDAFPPLLAPTCLPHLAQLLRPACSMLSFSHSFQRLISTRFPNSNPEVSFSRVNYAHESRSVLHLHDIPTNIATGDAFVFQISRAVHILLLTWVDLSRNTASHLPPVPVP